MYNEIRLTDLFAKQIFSPDYTMLRIFIYGFGSSGAENRDGISIKNPIPMFRNICYP
jgi:hypothetical protein